MTAVADDYLIAVVLDYFVGALSCLFAVGAAIVAVFSGETVARAVRADSFSSLFAHLP
jgi:hypothetical protein